MRYESNRSRSEGERYIMRGAMGYYRIRPVLIDAWRFDQDDTVKPDWVSDAFLNGKIFYQGGDDPYLTVQTFEVEQRAKPGDWVIREPRGIRVLDSWTFSIVCEPQ